MRSYLVRLVLVAATALILAGCTAESRKVRALERAAEYYKGGEFEKARIEYQNVLQKFPDDVTANERMALIWFDRGATMQSLVYLTKMNTLAPGNLDLRLKRAQLILSLGRPAEAKREALAILERSTAIGEALVLLTETVRDADDFKAADEYLKKFPEKNSVSYHLATANILILRNDAAGAKTALQRAISVDPKSAAAHSAMASYLLSQKATELAAAEFKLAADLSPPRSPERLKQASFIAQTKSVAEAIAMLTEMTRQLPDFQSAWRSLAQLAIFEKRYDDALALLQTVFSRDASDYEAHILRGGIWLAKGDVKRAIEDLNRLGEAYPGIGLEKYSLALAHLQNNDQPNAITALRQVVGQNPNNVEATLLLAQLNLRNGAPEQTAAAMSALVSRRPDLMQGFNLLIEASKAMGKLDELIKVIGQNIEKSPTNAQLYYVLGLTYLQQQKSPEARQNFEKTLELAPDALAAISELMNLDVKEGRTAAALKRAEALVARSPKLPAGYVFVARIQQLQGKWNEVEAAAIEAIKLDPNNSTAYGLLADSFIARIDKPDTLGRLETFLGPRIDNALSVLLGGQIYGQAKAYPKARDLYEKHLATNPKSSLVMNNLANLYSENFKQPDRAVEIGRKARAIDPSSPVIADTLGWILYQQKAYAEAQPLIEEAARSLAGNPEVQLHVGMVNRALGRNEPAAAAFKLAASFPGNSPAKDEAKRQLDQLGAGGAPAPAAK